MFNQVAYLIAGNGVSALIPFVRNILVARLISVEDFGIAATFGLTFALIEMMTNVAVDRLIVQAKDGDEERFQSSLQSLQVIRGVFGAVFLLSIAAPYAIFLSVPEVTWAYQIMALIPFIRGFAHLDIFRVQRDMVYSNFALVMGISPLASLLAAGGLALIYNDYRIMLWAIVAQQIAFTVLSHVVARRPYYLSWNTNVIKRALSFGLPLLGSNIMMFVIFQGDKLIIGNQLGPEILGLYSAVFLLVATPGMTLMGTFQSLTLPGLSKLQSEGEAFLQRAHIVFEVACLGAAGIVLGLIVIGSFAFILIFGERYEEALPILVLFGIAQALRLARSGIFIPFLAQARSKLVLSVSLLRFAAFPFGYYALLEGYGLIGLIACNIAGEVAALLLAVLFASRKQVISLEKVYRPVIMLFIFLSAAAYYTVNFPPIGNFIANLNSFQFAVFLIFAMFLCSLEGIRKSVRKMGRVYLRKHNI
jgi:O-antigen/teichoic acid export membrane protein